MASRCATVTKEEMSQISEEAVPEKHEDYWRGLIRRDWHRPTVEVLGRFKVNCSLRAGSLVRGSQWGGSFDGWLFSSFGGWRLLSGNLNQQLPFMPLCFGGRLGLTLLEFRNIFRYQQVLRSCDVLRVCFRKHRNWFFQFEGSSLRRSPWRLAVLERFEIPWNFLTVCIFDRLRVKSTFFNGWRFNFRPFDGWRLSPSRPSSTSRPFSREENGPTEGDHTKQVSSRFKQGVAANKEVLFTGLPVRPRHKMGFRSSAAKNGLPGEGRHEGLIPRNDVLTNGFIWFSLARTLARILFVPCQRSRWKTHKALRTWRRLFALFEAIRSWESLYNFFIVRV